MKLIAIYASFCQGYVLLFGDVNVYTEQPLHIS